MGERFESLDLKTITVGKSNPRKRFDPGPMEELKTSIAAKGILQPLLVTPRNGKFLLVAGERRLRAAKDLKLGAVPAMIRDMDDTEVLECQIIENDQREDLDPISEAEGFRRILKQPDYSVDRLADKIGRPKLYVQRRLLLADLPAKAQDLLVAGEIGVSTGLAIARLGDAREQESLAKAAARDGMSAREVAEEVRNAGCLLAQAEFDTKPCATCEHNGANQKDLFDTGTQLKGRCLNPKCYRQRSAEHQKAKLAKAKKEGRPVLKGSYIHEICRKHNAERMDRFQPQLTAAQRKECRNCPRKGLAMAKEMSWQSNRMEKKLYDVCTDAECRKKMIRANRRERARDTSSGSAAANRPARDPFKDRRLYSGLVPLLARSIDLGTTNVLATIIVNLLRLVDNAFGTCGNAAASILTAEGLLADRSHAEDPLEGLDIDKPFGLGGEADFGDAANDQEKLARVTVALAVTIGQHEYNDEVPAWLAAVGIRDGVSFRYTRCWLDGFFQSPQLRDLAKELGLKAGGSKKDLVKRILDAQDEKGALPMPKAFLEALPKPRKTAAPTNSKGGRKAARKRTRAKAGTK